MRSANGFQAITLSRVSTVCSKISEKSAILERIVFQKNLNGHADFSCMRHNHATTHAMNYYFLYFVLLLNYRAIFNTPRQNVYLALVSICIKNCSIVEAINKVEIILMRHLHQKLLYSWAINKVKIISMLGSMPEESSRLLKGCNLNTWYNNANMGRIYYYIYPETQTRYIRYGIYGWFDINICSFL